MAGKTRTYCPKKALGIFILGVTAITVCPTSVHADDTPFEMEGSQWMSFDHYKDADKRGHIATPAPVDDSATPASDRQAMPVAASAQAPASPVIATPARPIDLPIMPGMNKGMGLQVTSTEEEKTVQSAPPVLTTDAPPDIHLPVKGWQNPVTVGQAHKQNPDDLDANSDDTQMNVRMTYLPGSKLLPTPSREHNSAQSLTNDIAMQLHRAKKAEDPKTPSEQAACAAADSYKKQVDTYKKQQLDAIQGDRQTLKALQDAIASLGLQKQLDFMTGKDSALNAPSSQAPANIDMPTQTAIR